jgi:hypothetical protein
MALQVEVSFPLGSLLPHMGHLSLNIEPCHNVDKPVHYLTWFPLLVVAVTIDSHLQFGMVESLLPDSLCLQPHLEVYRPFVPTLP